MLLNKEFIEVVEAKDDQADVGRDEKLVRGNAAMLSNEKSYHIQKPINTNPYQNQNRKQSNLDNSVMCASQTQSSFLLNDMPSYISNSPSDDDASVSTLGSTDVPDQSSSKRSIFGDYWGTGMRASHAPVRKQSLNTIDTEDSTISRYTESIRNSKDWSSYINEEVLNTGKNSSHKHDSDGYEAYLKMNEAGRTALSSAASLKESLKNTGLAFTPCNPLPTPNKLQRSSTRRRIFPNISKQKVGSLPSYGYMYTKPKKGKAPLPYLLHNKNMLRSSLRDRITSDSFFSTESALLSQSKPTVRPTVSFETQVTIHEFEKPVQQFIHDGWSDRYCYLAA